MSRSGLAPRTRHAVHAAALIALLVAVLGLGSGIRSAPKASAAFVPPFMTATPAHGKAGSSVTLSTGGLFNATLCAPPGTYYFDATPLASAGSAGGGFAPATVKVPASAVAGTHYFFLWCTQATGAFAQYLRSPPFVVDPTPPPPTTTTTTTRPTTTTVTTPGQTTLPTTPGQTTTTAAGQTTTTTAPGDTTTTGPDSTDTTIPPDTVPGSTATRSGASLKFDALAIAPGSAVKAIGQGCDADAPVAVSIDSATVARTAADATGEFQTPLAVSSLQVGRYEVTAVCGPTLTAPLDIVLASEVDQGTTTTMIIIVFFVLLGLIAFRRQLFPGAPAPASAPPPDEVVDS